MFHLGWFLGNGTGMYPWYGTWANTYGRDWTKPDFFIDLATSLERGGFDLLFIEDTAMLEDTYGGSLDMTLKYGMMAPKNDPMPYIPLLAKATRHLGLVGTVSTIQYPPYLAARQAVTLDHLTEGRAGINVVTSVSHRVAQNYGYDQHLSPAERYEMAQEWTWSPRCGSRGISTRSCWTTTSPGTRTTPRCIRSTTRASTSSVAVP